MLPTNWLNPVCQSSKITIKQISRLIQGEVTAMKIINIRNSQFPIRFFAKTCLAAFALSCFFTSAAQARDLIGDVVQASLIRTPGNATFDPTAISGSATIVDPGVEFQGQAFALGSATIDAVIDIDSGGLTLQFIRTDNSSSDFGAGSAATLTWTISNLDWTGNDFEVELVNSIATGDSGFGDDPQDFVVTTTPTSIQIDWTGGFILGDGGALTVEYSVSPPAVPEPSTGLVLLFSGGVLALVRRRSPNDGVSV